MSALELVGSDRGGPVDDAVCPDEVVDRLLWRNAQRILHRHAIRLDGTCHWCGEPAPCPARELALRADEIARMPARDAIAVRNEITGMLPVLAAEVRSSTRPRHRRLRRQRSS
jgi:hypothetical protein